MQKEAEKAIKGSGEGFKYTVQEANDLAAKPLFGVLGFFLLVSDQIAFVFVSHVFAFCVPSAMISLWSCEKCGDDGGGALDDGDCVDDYDAENDNSDHDDDDDDDDASCR